MSQFPFTSLRNNPSYAETPGYQFLTRAGFVRPAAAGIFTLLPLSLKVLAKIERIVREELENIGGIEVLFPALLPREPFEITNRWAEFQETIFKLQDRKSSDYLLAPTHEEMFTLLAKEFLQSYQDFPALFYQIQTKYRDEARPRAGLIRGREFIMKDSYSFDLNAEGLSASYANHRRAYQRIFQRLGLETVIVSATSGAMGGSKSEEFLVPARVGEDRFITTESGYAANVEAFRDRDGRLLTEDALETLQDGDIAFNGEPITIRQGIELGHIFQLGKKYAQAYNWTVQVPDGPRVVPTMGSYGIGISRIMATIAELSCDDKGLIWPANLSPYDFHLVLAVDTPKVHQNATEISKQLTRRGYSVFCDDRLVSTGVKFKDADLIGISKIIIIGNLIKDHKIELKTRATGSTEVLTLDQLYSKF